MTGKTLSDYVHVYPVATKAQCDAILSAVKDRPYHRAMTVTPQGDYVIDTDRTNSNMRITGTQGLESIDGDLFNIFGDGARQYLDLHRNCTLSSDEGYSLLKYEVGEEYKEHTDSGSGMFRTLSAILYLNDDYAGGELVFPELDLVIKPKAGNLLLFPSNFSYIHKSTPITSGTKYSVVTWFK